VAGKYTFNVDNNSSDEAAEHAIEHLKNMVEFGKRAELALYKLETQGFYDKPTPTLSESVHHNIPYYSVTIHTFTKREEVSRSDLTPFELIKVEFGDKFDKSHYGGHEAKSVRLFAIGTAKVQQLDDTYLEEPFRKEIGRIRANQNYYSFIPRVSNGTCKLYTSLKVSPKAQASYRAIAQEIAYHLITTGEDVPHYNQITTDLQHCVPEWLVEDSVIERISNQILQQMRVLEILQS